MLPLVLAGDADTSARVIAAGIAFHEPDPARPNVEAAYLRALSGQAHWFSEHPEMAHSVIVSAGADVEIMPAEVREMLTTLAPDDMEAIKPEEAVDEVWAALEALVPVAESAVDFDALEAAADRAPAPDRLPETSAAAPARIDGRPAPTTCSTTPASTTRSTGRSWRRTSPGWPTWAGRRCAGCSHGPTWAARWAPGGRSATTGSGASPSFPRWSRPRPTGPRASP